MSKRRFPELGVQTTKEIPETQPVESSTRAMRSAQSMLPEENS